MHTITPDINKHEKILLVIVDYKKNKGQWGAEDLKAEMTELVIACGGEVVESVICRLDKPSASYLIGEGKVKEVALECELKAVDTIIFSEDLKGSQQRNLEKELKVKTIDRTQLILDIFARNATSLEGKIQVELAQLEYLLPRLVGKGIELSRLGGGIGTRGPGETKLEVDRRRISQRITKLKKNLEEMLANRVLKRKKRQDKGTPMVSLVGYTNAGKTTLLNKLTQSSELTKDGLFTTLDSVTRQLVLPNNQHVVVSDTVGFMHDLPHHLIEAFKATLEVVKEADLLLHVIDISQENFRNYHESVEVVLKELEAFDKPTIIVLNKIDKIEDNHWIKSFEENFDHAVAISAKEGINIDGLLAKITELLSIMFIEINVDLPLNRMDLVSLAHKEGQVYSVKYYNDKINLRASLPYKLAGKFRSM